MILVLMGVSGSGKTTIGRLLAEKMGWPFYDGDDFHPPANITKMSQGIPLTEEDRMPWLAALHAGIDSMLAEGKSAVIACSALTRIDRQRLLQGDRGVELVYLHGDYDLIRQRLEARHGHFFRPELLASQFKTLEEPHDVFTVNVDQSPEEIVKSIMDHLGLVPVARS